MPSTARFCEQSINPKPSKDIFRRAILKCVNGKALQIYCIQLGKTVIGKNVPPSNICGKAKTLISNGIVESCFTMLEKTNPTPINTSSNNIAKMIISKKVAAPFTSVNPNQYLPSSNNATTLNN